MIEKFVNTNSKMIYIFHQSYTFLKKISFQFIGDSICQLCTTQGYVSWNFEYGNITVSKSGSSSILPCEYCKVTHFIAEQISALIASLVVYRERLVIVVSGREDNFEFNMEAGDTFVILGLVK